MSKQIKWKLYHGLLLCAFISSSKSLNMYNQAEMDDFAHKHLKKDNNGYFYGPPTFTDADEGDWLMPAQHRCDGCIAVAYQFEKKFMEEENRRSKKGARLTESQILDVSDKVCSKSFKTFGLKMLNGQNRLSGEGLRAHYEPGISAAGDGWMERVQGICKELLGLYEEESIYHMYKDPEDNRRLAENICHKYCTALQMKEFKEDQSFVTEMAARDKAFEDRFPQ